MADYRKFHKTNKNGNPVSVHDFAIFQYLTEKENIFILGGIPYIYQDGVYKADLNGTKLKTMIRRLIHPDLVNANIIDRVYKLFINADELQTTAEQINAFPVHWINFRNAFYDPIRKMLIPHAPSYKAVNQIPHEYDPRKRPQGKQIDEWLHFIAPDNDSREMLLQFCGYCMTTDTRQQKFLTLIGEGGTGKSTMIRLLSDTIGADNISNVSLKDLTMRFSSFDLMGKLLNCCADIEGGTIEETGVIKQIIGEDPIRAEAKGKQAFKFQSYAKLIFSANSFPTVLNEKTSGFYRRLLILEMNRKPDATKPNYLETLETETNHFIYLCMEALGRMYEAGRLTDPERSRKAVQQIRNDSDSVEAWIQEDMFQDEKSELERGFLYDRYAQYCDIQERQKVTRKGFFKTLREKGYQEKRTSYSRYFIGLSADHDRIGAEMSENTT